MSVFMFTLKYIRLVFNIHTILNTIGVMIKSIVAFNVVSRFYIIMFYKRSANY